MGKGSQYEPAHLNTTALRAAIFVTTSSTLAVLADEYIRLLVAIEHSETCITEQATGSKEDGMQV